MRVHRSQFGAVCVLIGMLRDDRDAFFRNAHFHFFNVGPAATDGLYRCCVAVKGDAPLCLQASFNKAFCRRRDFAQVTMREEALQQLSNLGSFVGVCAQLGICEQRM
jgi:hypothetical protein